MCLPLSYSENASLNPYSFCFSLYHFPLYCTLSSSCSLTFFPNFYWFVFIVSHTQGFSSLQSRTPLLTFFTPHSFLKHRFKCVHIMFFQDQTDQTYYELSFLTSTGVYLVRLHPFSCITFCPVFCSSNVTKTSSGWPVSSDLLADIWHQCSFCVLNQKICQTALAWVVHRLLWWQQSFLLWRVSLYPYSHRESSACILSCNCPSVSWSWQTLTCVLKLPLRFCLVSGSSNFSLELSSPTKLQTLVHCTSSNCKSLL